MGRASYDEALLPLLPLFVISTPAKGLIRRKCNVIKAASVSGEVRIESVEWNVKLMWS